MPLKKDIVQIPLGGKVDESVNEKVLQPGSMVAASNCHYTRRGQVEKSKGNTYIATTIDSSGDRIGMHTFLASDVGLLVAGDVMDSAAKSKLGEHGQLLSLNDQEDKWYKRGEWMPIRQSKQPLNYSDEFIWSVETTIHSGYVYLAAVILDPPTASPREYHIKISVIEQSTGHVLLENYKLTTGKTSPRFVNVGTKVHLYVAKTEPIGSVDSSIYLYVLDPTTPTTVPAPILCINDAPASGYIPLFDAAYYLDSTYGHCSALFSNGTSGTVALIRTARDESGTLRRTTTDTGRAPDGHLTAQRCYDYNTSNYYMVVAHGEGANVRCQVFDDALAVHTASYAPFAGTTPEMLAVCEDPADSYHLGAANSAYRIYVQVSTAYTGPGTGSNFRRILTERRTFAAGALVGSSDQQLLHWRLATRPFTKDGLARVWCTFDTGLSDAQPRAALFHWSKADPTDASCVPETDCYWGLDTFERPQNPADITPPPTFPYPPVGNVTVVGSVYYWGSYEAVRVLSVGVAPITSKQIVLNKIDWNGSHYKAAKSGRLMILPGGRMNAYDGGCHDYGFAHAPEITGIVDGGAGSMAAGTYSFLAIYEWVDGVGQLHRSAPSNIVTFVSAGTRQADIGIKPIMAGDYKKNITDMDVQIVIYRNTQTDLTLFHRLKSILNEVPAAGEVVTTDGQGDAGVSGQPLIYTHGGILAAGTPPPTQILHRHRDRIFAVDEEDPTRIVYTKPIESSLAPEWSGTLVHRMPEDIVALSTLQNDLVAFAENSVYVVRGGGIDIFGTNGYYLEELRIPSVGAQGHSAVLNTNIGLLWYGGDTINLMTLNSMTDLGHQIKDSVSGLLIRRIEESADEKLIRVLYSGGMLIYNYEFNRWSVLSYHASTNDMARDYAGDLYFWYTLTAPLLKEANVYTYGPGPTDITYSMETPWVKLGNLTGYQRIFWIQILGEWASSHDLNVQVYIDYQTSVYETITASKASVERPYEILITPAVKRCQAIKLKISDSSPSGKSAILTGVEIVAGFLGPRLRNKNGV